MSSDNLPAETKREIKLRGPYPPGKREETIEAAYTEILQGDTLKQIAQRHGVPEITLRMWLQSTGDQYRELRQLWLDQRIAEADMGIEAASDHLSLARARERWKSATWYAERRDPARYGARLDTGSQAAQIVVHTSLSLSPREGYVIDQQDEEEAADGEAE